jgi:hypothetical protein
VVVLTDAHVGATKPALDSILSNKGARTPGIDGIAQAMLGRPHADLRDLG